MEVSQLYLCPRVDYLDCVPPVLIKLSIWRAPPEPVTAVIVLVFTVYIYVLPDCIYLIKITVKTKILKYIYNFIIYIKIKIYI